MLSWRIVSPSSSPTTYCLSKTHILSFTTVTPSRDPTASLRSPEISMDESLKYESKPNPNSDVVESTSNKMKNDMAPGDQDQEEEQQISISRIQVPRQKYISVSKAELLDAIVSVMFHSQDDRDQFLLIASCLDSILHVEHKSILEEMRSDFFFTDSAGDERSVSSDRKIVNNGIENKSAYVVNTENFDPDSDTINRNGSINKYGDDEGEETEPNELPPFNYGLDLWNLIGPPSKNVEKYNESRLAVATRFQRAFMQLLNNAQFEELSATDLVLTSALNTNYLLTLPVYVDWERASESNAIIFRRGYATERQKGLLIVEKLDYIQSRLLQKIFFIISKPLEKVGKWISEALTNASQTQEVQDIIKRMKLGLKELSFFQQSYFSNGETSDSLLGADQLSDSELPIWLAAQKAVSRYEGFLSPVGPRGRLLRKLLTQIGFTSSTPETTFQPETNSNASEPYLRPISLSRISLSDIWRPASRKYCGNDLWKMLKTSVSILLSKSILQEPAFEELILLYTNDMDKNETKDKSEVPTLQLKIYERIPIPDLPVNTSDTSKSVYLSYISWLSHFTCAFQVIFPHKKLSFRIIDTVRLDVATIVGLLAFFINYKFEDILSSPSAVFLDVIATTALILYVTRVVLGYKQTRDRYELLVNKTLYEKTLASGFGSVHFLLDASEQQQYKEAILTYAILLKEETCQGTCRQTVGDKCEKFMYNVLKEKVEMPVDKAVNILVRLGMVSETSIDGRSHLQATTCSKAYEALKERWNGLLG